MVNNGYKKKNANVRKLEIKNFRNIGISFDEIDPSVELVLNRGLGENELGELVFLVGPNNSGKSNVLAALESFNKGIFEASDSPDFMYCQQSPIISMIILDDNKKGILQVGNIDKNEGNESVILRKKIETLNLELNSLVKQLEEYRKENSEIKEEIEIIDIDRLKNKDKYPNTNERKLIDTYISNNYIKADNQSALETFLKDPRYISRYYYDDNNESDIVDSVKKRIVELKEQGPNEKKYVLLTKQYNDNTQNIARIKNEIESKKEAVTQHTQKIEIAEKSSTSQVKNDESNEILESKYLLYPKIINYKQNSIKQTDLSCKPGNPTSFIKNVFKIMEKDPNVLENIYQKFEGKNQKGYLNKFKGELNKELPDKITKRFNDMYFCDEGDEYSFEFDLESDLVTVILYRGDVPLDLDKQSTGFKWFFDFFFNFAYNEELKAGDIIIMDEPATNIHTSGQFELRQFFKELAKKYGLTFVISTHSPFLIDCDYLDELRLMQRDDRGYVTIADKFDMVNNGADKLTPILNGLTIGRHILTGAQKVIYTEGITDYNYLTAFKLLFAEEYPELKSLFFLPVGGIKNDRKVLDALCKIDSNPLILIDGDKAGTIFQGKAEGTRVNAVSLTEVNPNLKEIEDLFSEEEKTKFNLNDKDWNGSALFKKNIFEAEISDQTKKQFKEVLDYLLTV